MALPPQPMDRVHPYVARVRPQWSSRSTASRRPAFVSAASSDDGHASSRSILSSGSCSVLPGAHPDVPFGMVTMGSPVPRQRLQHRHPHPATKFLGLGCRLGHHFSHCFQPWYGHHVAILLFSFLHCGGQWCHLTGRWHRLLYSSWSLSSQQRSYSS